jgi:hypothetical protein
MLPVIRLAHLDARYFCHSVGLVRDFQRAAKEVFLFHRLGTFPWVNTGRPEEEKTFRSDFPGRVNDIGLDNQIIVNELRRIGFVGPDSAYLGSGKENILGLFLFKKTFHICLALQIQLSVGTSNEVSVPFSL